jgi:4-hydroxy-2-oxoheptanedioate aldolase
VSLRETLESGGPAIGLWASIPSALSAEVAALAGPDYVVADQQHGALDPVTLMAMLQAIAGAGCAGLVRVARNEPFPIGQALDLGAAGVIVPMVESGEDAATRPRASAPSARCAPEPASGRCAW